MVRRQERERQTLLSGPPSCTVLVRSNCSSLVRHLVVHYFTGTLPSESEIRGRDAELRILWDAVRANRIPADDNVTPGLSLLAASRSIRNSRGIVSRESACLHPLPFRTALARPLMHL